MFFLFSRRAETYDTGTEFAFHVKLKQALKGLESYFCDPYSPWQKGRLENSNGRLRKDFSRKLNLQKRADEDFNESIENYNSTPRKGLKWFAPNDVFQKIINRVALEGLNEATLTVTTQKPWGHFFFLKKENGNLAKLRGVSLKKR